MDWIISCSSVSLKDIVFSSDRAAGKPYPRPPCKFKLERTSASPAASRELPAMSRSRRVDDHQQLRALIADASQLVGNSGIEVQRIPGGKRVDVVADRHLDLAGEHIVELLAFVVVIDPLVFLLSFDHDPEALEMLSLIHI